MDIAADHVLRDIQHWHELLEAMWPYDPASFAALGPDPRHPLPVPGCTSAPGGNARLLPVPEPPKPRRLTQDGCVIILDSDGEGDDLIMYETNPSDIAGREATPSPVIADETSSQHIQVDAHTRTLITQLAQDFIKCRCGALTGQRSETNTAKMPSKLTLEDRVLIHQYYQQYPYSAILIKLLAAILGRSPTLVKEDWQALAQADGYPSAAMSHSWLKWVDVPEEPPISTPTTPHDSALPKSTITDADYNEILADLDKLLRPTDATFFLPPLDPRWLHLWDPSLEGELSDDDSEAELDHLVQPNSTPFKVTKRTPTKESVPARRNYLPPFAVVNKVDQERLPLLHFIDHRVIHPRIELPSPETIVGCECTTRCDPATCPCIIETGELPYKSDGRIREGFSVSYECNDACTCAKFDHPTVKPSTTPNKPTIPGTQEGTPNRWHTLARRGKNFTPKRPRGPASGRRLATPLSAAPKPKPTCPNRAIQNSQPFPHVEVFKTRDRGWGVRATQSITKGTFIAEYVGEVISAPIEHLRSLTYDQLNLLYVFQLDLGFEPLPDGNNESPMLYVDALYYCNVSRFINHSCESNLSRVTFFINYRDRMWQRLAFFSRRAIEEGEELTINYHCTTSTWTCKCGAPNCQSRQSTNETL
ncbi:hypothetical protein IWQ62_003171 [Dispira parvispora]|uniref:SET domain-containing protein n=1 Tax=Dispira parvispora TaxID=1520584 RepID=A0A9W8E7A6_9FUNG|nr:hypothetical protein IWQ62_003171 [Dispira parvispora]